MSSVLEQIVLCLNDDIEITFRRVLNTTIEIETFAMRGKKKFINRKLFAAREAELSQAGPSEVFVQQIRKCREEMTEYLKSSTGEDEG